MAEAMGASLVTALAALAVLTLFSLLSALLERSGPIRLRRWAEEAGGALRALYDQPLRFQGFRYLLNLASKLALVALYGATVRALEASGARHSWLVALVVTGALLAGVELWNRHRIEHDPEAALRQLTALYRALRAVLAPLVNLLAPVLPRPPQEEVDIEEVSDEMIEAFIDVGRREGILDVGEEELLRGLVDFGDTQVRSVMTPRVDMVCSPVSASVDELVELFLASGHSRIPLYQDSIDQIIGILHIRDLMRARHRGEEVRRLLKPPHFVPETKPLATLLKELQARHQELAVVVDEYGGTEGLVTIEDLLEEIFGEIADEHDASEPVQVKLPDGSWRLHGRAHIEELEDLFGVRLDDEAPYETVGGLIFSVLGHVPRAGDTVEAHGLRFLVEAADRRRVGTVRVARAAPVDEEAESA